MTGAGASDGREAPLQILLGGSDPAAHSGYEQHPPRMGFFTDTSLCIGCKACEVACKEWNGVPEDGLEWTGHSHDNTQGLGADSWRHVAFVEQRVPLGAATSPIFSERRGPGEAKDGFRWLMSSDVCKHCTHAACLDVCPTGAIFRTEFGTVVVQADICNGCGYCVPACPYGVLDKREDDGRIFKCTLCYDRLEVGQEPACAKACPTDSIQFGDLDELRERAADTSRAAAARRRLRAARLYGRRRPHDGVGGRRRSSSCSSMSPRPTASRPTRSVTTRDLPAHVAQRRPCGRRAGGGGGRNVRRAAAMSDAHVTRGWPRGRATRTRSATLLASLRRERPW